MNGITIMFFQLLFCWLFCILVVAAFADIVAGTFKGWNVVDGVRGENIVANGAVAKKVRWFMYVPLGVMFAVTFTAFGMVVFQKAVSLLTATSTNYFGDVLQLVFATIIIVLGVCVVIQVLRRLLSKNVEPTQAEMLAHETDNQQIIRKKTSNFTQKALQNRNHMIQ